MSEIDSQSSLTCDNNDDGESGQVLPFPTAPESQPSHGPTSVPLSDVLGDVLRTERLDQDRTLADVAERAAVSLPYLSEVERGRKEVSSDVLDAITRSLGIEVADVLERAADRLRGRADWRGPTCSLIAA